METALGLIWLLFAAYIYVDGKLNNYDTDLRFTGAIICCNIWLAS